MKESFRKIAHAVSTAAGSPWTFSLAVLIIIVWLTSGPLFNFSNTWQLVINTCTTIVTFLMVFLIQNTQNRDAKAMQLKLDELIRATRARDKFMDIEDLSDEELSHITEEFRRVREHNGHPAMKKFQSKLEAAHHQRIKSSVENVADQVVSILNPFASRKDDMKSQKNKLDERGKH